MIRALSFALSLWLFGAASAPARAQSGSAVQRLAVLEFEVAHGATTDRIYFSDLARSVATKRTSYFVMTRESTEALLEANGKHLADCTGNCEIEIGRKLGADYIVSGRLTKIGSNQLLTVRLFSTRDGALLGAEEASAKTADEFIAAARAAIERLFAPVDSTAEMNPPQPAPVVPPSSVKPSAEVMVPFASVPSGASVTLDGAPLCADTPCVQFVTRGAHDVLFQRAGSLPQHAQLNAQDGTRVDVTLVADASAPRPATPAPIVLQPAPGADARHSRTESVARGNGQCVAPPSGMISWWPGDTDARDIVGPNSGELNGTTLAPGLVVQAFQFDGLHDVTAPSTGLPTGGEDRTLEFWGMRETAPAADARLHVFAQYGSLGVHDGAFVVLAKQGQLMFSPWGSTIAGPEITANVWHHIAVTSERNTVKLYLDGAQVAGGTPSDKTTANSKLVIGGIGRAPDGSVDRLTGMVDELSIYNRALTQSEIAAIAAAGSAGKCKPGNTRR